MTPQSAKKAKYKSLESLPYGGCPKGRFFYFRGAAAPLKTALPSADHSAPQARPNLFMRPKAATMFFPAGRAFGPTISFRRRSRTLFCRKAARAFPCAPKAALFIPSKRGASSPPFSFFPHCAGRSGGPFNLIDSGRPKCGLPASNAALAARPRWAVAASPPKRERAAGAVQERKRQGHRGPPPDRKQKWAPGPPIAAFLRKCSAAPHRGPRAICQRGQCRARRRELQEWSDQSPSHWGPRRAQRGGEWNHVPP